MVTKSLDSKDMRESVPLAHRQKNHVTYRYTYRTGSLDNFYSFIIPLRHGTQSDF